MKTIIKYEWKKIFDRRFNVIAMLAGLLLVVTCAVSLINTCSTIDGSTGEYVKGARAIKLEQEKNNATTDFLTEEYLTRMVENIQAARADLGSDYGFTQIYGWAAEEPRADMARVIAENYSEIEVGYDWTIINEINTDGGIHFYERRMEKIASFLNKSFPYGDYSEQEKEFWISKAEKVDTPFAWGDKSMQSIVWNIVEIAFYLMFIIAICISPVFASEYETGVVALLLTTKNGKTKLATAKIIAAVSFAIAYVVSGIVLGILVGEIMVGIDGLSLPVQLWGSHIPYNWSIGQALAASCGIMLLIALTITMLTLVMSSRIKSSMVVLVMNFLLLIGPALLTTSNNGLWNKIYYLFPVRIMQVRDVLKTFNSYQFGNVVISYLGMIVITYTAVSILSLWKIRGGFANHQVRN